MRRDVYVAPKAFRVEDISARSEDLARLFDDHGVEVALLFGSLAAGVAEAGDVDLGILLDQDTPERRAGLHEALCRLFSADNVDVVSLRNAPFLLRKRMLLAGRVLRERVPGTVSRLIEEVLFEQADFEAFGRLLEQRLRERVRGGLSMAERRLDKERVTAYLSQLDVSLRRLGALRRDLGTFEAFKADEDRHDLAVHHLRIALECVLDICRHFLASTGVSLHEVDSTNLIDLAGRSGLLPAAFAARIRGMAGLRNAIVHAYVRPDDEAIYEAVVGRLGDFDDFARHVLDYLARQAEEG